MKRLLPALAVFLLLVTPAVAQDCIDAYLDGGDDATSLRKCRLLSEQGNARAQFFLGSLYYDHVPPNYAEAMKWLRLAAEQGFGDAQLSLGNIYLKGKGVPQDYVQAHMWFNLASAQGNTNAIELRDKAERLMTLTDISTAQRMAREWLQAHPQ